MLFKQNQEYPTVIMEDWKAHTKKHIPEVAVDEDFDKDIDSPMMLWLELQFLFTDAAEKGNDNLIRRIFEETDYYFEYANTPEGGSDDYSTAVALAFIEHLLDDKVTLPYVLKYFPKEDFIGCKELLTYHNSEKKYYSVLKLYDK